MEGVRVETRPVVEVPVTTTILGRPQYRIDMRGIFWSGLFAGGAYFILQMILHPIFLGINGNIPMRRIGAIIVGQEYLTPSTFNFGIFILGLIFSCCMGILATYVGSWALRPITYDTAILGGIVLGAAFYVINYYMWSGLFPWLADARNWVTFIDHLIAGFLAGLIYIAVRRQVVDERGRNLGEREISVR